MRIIGHLDMDAFFAAVEERDHGWYRGKPIVVGADPQGGRGRGVVSTANYKAREYGIHSAQPISVAWRLAKQAEKWGKPATLFVAGRWEAYERVSEDITAIARKYVPLVEEASVDEFYLDLTFARSYERAEGICRELKEEIKKREKLTCSIGIGPNKLIAKIASGHQKPDGATVIRPGEVENFLDPQPADAIPGIGPKSMTVLAGLGVKTVSDLRQLSREKLQELFGKWGAEMHEKARGIDDSPVEESHEIKSIGEQETFPQDTLEPNYITERLEALCRNVLLRLKESGFQGYRTITITVRFADFETRTRSRTLPEAVRKNSPAAFKTLHAEALRLLMPFFDKRENPKRMRIRLVGVRVERLE